MTHLARPAWLATLLVLSGCCMDGLGPPATVTPLAPPAAHGGPGPTLPGGSGGSTGTPITFAPGSADPSFAQGFAGGPIAGTTYDPSCYAGHYPSTPSHVVTVTTALPYFRIMAYSAAGTDLTMLVRQPNGLILCNDDFDGLNPTVELTTPLAGEYQVYVGTYSSPAPEPYELGVSTQSYVSASSMHTGAPGVVASTPPSATVGALLLSGTASVTSLTGSVPGVVVGSSCTYTQTRVLATGGPGVLDCRWQVTCGLTDLYGGTVPGGYQPCTDPSWASGTLAMNSATSNTDTDPTFLFSGSTLTIGDDASGSHGEFTATLTTSTVPIPPTMPVIEASS